MNTPSLVSRLDHKALPQWNSQSPGYIAMQSAPRDDASRQASRMSTAVRRYWWVAALIWALIAIPASIAIYKNFKPQYVATGSIQVQPDRVDLFSGNEKVMPFYVEYLRTQADLMKDPKVLEDAAKSEQLASFGWFRELPDQVFYLQQNVTVETVPATQNIRISAAHEDALSAKAMVAAVINAYMADNERRQGERLKRDQGQLVDLSKKTADMIKDYSADLEKLMQQKNATWSDDFRKYMTDVLTSQRTTLQDLQKSRFAINEQIKALEGKPVPSKEVFGASIPTDTDPQIQMWNKQHIEAYQQDLVLATKFNAQPAHPDRRALKRQMESLSKQIETRRAEIRDNAWKQHEAATRLEDETRLAGLKSDLQTVDSQIEMLVGHIQTSETAAGEAGGTTQAIASLKLQIEEAKEKLKRYEGRLEEIDRQNSPIGRITARPPLQPLTPTVDKRPKLAAAANGVGLLLGLGVLVILMKLRDKVDHAEDLPNSFQPLIVGTVSHAGAAARGIQGRMSRKILGEEMRLLHANLLPPGPMQRRIMMITSPTPSNGKTSIASQLALSLAKSGLEVLLIDADLRKRDLSTMFDVGFRPGLADLLQGKVPELIRPVELLPNLRLMGAGAKLDRNPVELFQRKHFHESLNLLQEKFDCIVVDTPPTLVVADARLIARSADEVLCVVRAQVSSPGEVNQTLDALQRITGKTPKIILNGVAHKQNYYKYKFAYSSTENTAGVPADSLD